MLKVVYINREPYPLLFKRATRNENIVDIEDLDTLNRCLTRDLREIRGNNLQVANQILGHVKFREGDEAQAKKVVEYYLEKNQEALSALKALNGLEVQIRPLFENNEEMNFEDGEKWNIQNLFKGLPCDLRLSGVTPSIRGYTLTWDDYFGEKSATVDLCYDETAAPNAGGAEAVDLWRTLLERRLIRD